MSASLVDIIFELVDGLSVLRGLRLVSTKAVSDRLETYCYGARESACGKENKNEN